MIGIWVIVIVELLLIVGLKLRQDYVNGCIYEIMIAIRHEHSQNTKDISKIKAICESKHKVKTSFWL